MFAFSNPRYKHTRRGVDVEGTITLDGKPVGWFEQRAFCACLIRFDNSAVREAFLVAAGDLAPVDYADQLLNEAESRLLATMNN